MVTSCHRAVGPATTSALPRQTRPAGQKATVHALAPQGVATRAAAVVGVTLDGQAEPSAHHVQTCREAEAPPPFALPIAMTTSSMPRVLAVDDIPANLIALDALLGDKD